METRNDALRYIANRPRTVEEMREHLRNKGRSEESINQVIEDFISCKYLDDVKYTEMYIRYALGKKKALFRIKYELQQKGVREFDIEDGIYLFEEENNVDIREVEFENAHKEAEKILGKFNGQEIEKKHFDKLARRLNSLGYSAGTITSILGEYR